MITSNDIISAVGAMRLPEPTELRAVVTDSREVKPGSLFVALRGENLDGHSFVLDAIQRGAAAVLAEWVQEGLPHQVEISICDLRSGGALGGEALRPPILFLVPDSLRALQQLAAYWRDKQAVEVVGVTGSVGKTSTKEMIAAVLQMRFRVLKNEKNLNNEIGLPLTILQLRPGHEMAVLEMGMYGLGEIRLLCEISKPSVGVVTNVGPSHLERLGTMERIAQAKAELVEALPATGVAVLNGDDPLVRAMASKTRARVFIYGHDRSFDLWADEVESFGLEGIRLRLHYGEDALYLRVPLLGEHSVHTVLAAASVGLLRQLTWEEIVSALSVVPEQLRLVVVPAVNDATLIDDTYNSSPPSALAALNLLNELEGRRVAVLGDMLELGAYEAEGHKLVGRRAREVVSLLVAVGPRGRLIGEEALAGGLAPEQVVFARDNAEAIAHLHAVLQPGDCVLVKGSRGMRMEEIVQGVRS